MERIERAKGIDVGVHVFYVAVVYEVRSSEEGSEEAAQVPRFRRMEQATDWVRPDGPASSSGS